MHKSKKKKRFFNIGSGEKKIMIVLVYYSMLVEFALMAFSLATRNVNQFRTAVTLHFLCESRGHNPANPCDRTQLEELKYPGVNLIAYVMLVLFPAISFTYVINFRKLKRWFFRVVVKKSSRSQANSTSDLRKFSVCTTMTYALDKSVVMEEAPMTTDLSLTNSGNYGMDPANGNA